MELRVNGPVDITAVRDRVPKLDLKTILQVVQPADGRVVEVTPSFNLMGLRVFDWVEIRGPDFGDDLANLQGYPVNYHIILSREFVKLVEDNREHDVPVTVSFQLKYILTTQPAQLGRYYANVGFEISENRWLKILDEIGYGGGWSIEVLRPKVEGWTNAVSLLDRAHERLASHGPEQAIAHCRAAWNSVYPSIKENKEGISVEVDRGSTPEAGRQAKSERVFNAQDWIYQFTHTGAHPETYAATMDDAWLAYRLTVSMMSYLSRKQVEAERHKAP